MGTMIRSWTVLLPCALLLLAATGCTERPPTSYRLVIDSGFSADEMTALVAGADDWLAHVPDLTLEISVGGDCSGIENDVICVRPTDHAGIVAHGGNADSLNTTNTQHGLCSSSAFTSGIGGKDGGQVWIAHSATPVPDGIFRAAAEHEFGHAMGLSHDTKPGAIMYPSTTELGPSVSCEDVSRWYGLRGQSVPSRTGC